MTERIVGRHLDHIVTADGLGSFGFLELGDNPKATYFPLNDTFPDIPMPPTYDVLTAKGDKAVIAAIVAANVVVVPEEQPQQGEQL